jgi:hypothetical protein
MAMKITDTQMTSDLTRHTAQAWPVPDEQTTWSATWLPGRALTQPQAITAMTIAEAVIEHADDLVDNGSRWWLQINQWAVELGITGPHAVVEASLSPEDHDAALRVQVILPDPGPMGYLYSLDRATGKATVRFDGVTVTMDACRLQYCGNGAALPAGEERQKADEDGGSVLAAPAVAEPDGAPLELTGDERSDMLTVMTEAEAKRLLAYIAGCAPKVFDEALTTPPWSLADQLLATRRSTWPSPTATAPCAARTHRGSSGTRDRSTSGARTSSSPAPSSTRRMKQRITGAENPTRRQWRKASNAVLAEAREIEEAERRVLREFGEGGR